MRADNTRTRDFVPSADRITKMKTEQGILALAALIAALALAWVVFHGFTVTTKHYPGFGDETVKTISFR